jgi:hypothetical protein
MTHGRVPSVSEIRLALEDIPGAIREEPRPEDVREGTDRATPLWSPDRGNFSEAPALDMPDSPEDGDGLTDEPGVIFEVPPDLTEAEIRNVLGEREIGDRPRSGVCNQYGLNTDLTCQKTKPGQRKHPLTWFFRSGDRI